VLFIGTSLTAGLGLQPDQAFPALIERIADSAGTPITTVNAGVSGETTAGALRRIDWVLRTPADVVVLEMGANDALRGLPVADARANIEAIIDRVKQTQASARVILIQIEAPPNLGLPYSKAFHAMYGEVAEAKGVTLLPFLLDSVYGRPQLNQDDGIHPNAAGERIVARNVWEGLYPVIRSLYMTRGHGYSVRENG
jgi:acyl-CoA thioesterase-1